MKNFKKIALRTVAAFVLLTSAVIVIETSTGANTVKASDGLCGVTDAACVQYALNHGFTGVALTGYTNCDRNCSATNVARGYIVKVYVSNGVIIDAQNVPNL